MGTGVCMLRLLTKSKENFNFCIFEQKLHYYLEVLHYYSAAPPPNNKKKSFKQKCLTLVDPNKYYNVVSEFIFFLY